MSPAANQPQEITKCWVNGIASVVIDVFDRGLQYGDGLFEVMAVKDGRILLEEYHLQSLADGCERLFIPQVPVKLLRRELQSAAEGQAQGVLRLILTRGSGDRGYRPSPHAQVTRILSRHAWPTYSSGWEDRGIHVRICDTHLGHNRRLAGLKHLNRLEQVLAQREWSEQDNIQEGLMLDDEGSVIGGTMSNVFAWLSHGVLATPSLRLAGVGGVLRRYILERAEQGGMQTRVASLSLAELMQAREIFVCNSIIGVWPVVAIGHWKYAVGSVTRNAQIWVNERW
ncbi:MAG: aminodeoxychorismate lyase [Gammaproteobacteria bacterium]